MEITTSAWVTVASDTTVEYPVNFLMIKGSQPFRLSLSSHVYRGGDSLSIGSMFAGFIYNNVTPIKLKSLAGTQTVEVVLGIDTD